MKKKDLVPGQVYATKHGAPRLLISPLVWSKTKHYTHGETQWWLMRRNARPHRSEGYGTGAAGVLTVLKGISEKGGEELQEWGEDRGKWWVERLSSIQQGDRGTSAHSELIEQLRQEVKELRFHLDVDNYTTWAGPWAQVVQELEERSHAIEKSYARLSALNDTRVQRVKAVSDELRKQYNVEPIGTERVTVHGDYGTTSSVPNGLTLSLADLELILNLQEEK